MKGLGSAWKTSRIIALPAGTLPAIPVDRQGRERKGKAVSFVDGHGLGRDGEPARLKLLPPLQAPVLYGFGMTQERIADSRRQLLKLLLANEQKGGEIKMAGQVRYFCVAGCRGLPSAGGGSSSPSSVPDCSAG